MKRTLLAIAIISLTVFLINTAWGQPRPRKMQPKKPSNFSWGESNSGSQQQQNNRQKQPRTRPNQNAFRPNPTGDGTTQQLRKGKRLNAIKFDGIDGEIKAKKPNAAKYDGIDGESNDARRKKPNAAGNSQNLLPHIEQDNVYKNANPKMPNRKRRAKTP